MISPNPGRPRQLRQLHRPRLRHPRRPPRPIRRKRAPMPRRIRIRHPLQPRSPTPRARSPHRQKSQPLHRPRNQLPIKRARDQNRNPQIPKPMRTRQHRAMPERKHHRPRQRMPHRHPWRIHIAILQRRSHHTNQHRHQRRHDSQQQLLFTREGSHNHQSKRISPPADPPSRSASAIIVSVGSCALPSGNTAALATDKFPTPCTRISASTTLVRGSSPMQAPPIACRASSNPSSAPSPTSPPPTPPPSTPSPQTPLQMSRIPPHRPHLLRRHPPVHHHLRHPRRIHPSPNVTREQDGRSCARLNCSFTAAPSEINRRPRSFAPKISRAPSNIAPGIFSACVPSAFPNSPRCTRRQHLPHHRNPRPLRLHNRQVRQDRIQPQPLPQLPRSLQLHTMQRPSAHIAHPPAKKTQGRNSLTTRARAAPVNVAAATVT